MNMERFLDHANIYKSGKIFRSRQNESGKILKSRVKSHLRSPRKLFYLAVTTRIANNDKKMQIWKNNKRQKTK